MLIFGERQLVHVLADYEAHYNTHRPHRALEQHSPIEGGKLTEPGRAACCGGLKSSVV